MNPIQREELTGLIDGELAPERAAEVECALRENPDLQREYEQLLTIHSRIFAFAEGAALAVQPTGARPAVMEGLGLSQLIRWGGAAMFTMRVLCKLLPTSIGVGLGVIALAIVAGGITFWLIQISNAEANRYSQTSLSTG